MPSVALRRSQRPRRFVVCGDSPLAYRLVNELVSRFGADVTVVLRAKNRNHGPRIARLPGVRIIEAAEVDGTTLRAADITEARALALVNQDDVGNIHAALRAYELNPNLRVVVRMFNMSLGHRIRTLFADCAVLSDSAMAAPSFVAAALGEVAPSHIRLPGRTLYVAHQGEVPAAQVVCGLAATTGGTRLLPADQENADLVLAIADGAGRDRLSAHRRGRAALTWQRLRLLLGNNLVRIGLVLIFVLLLGLVLHATVGGYGWGNAVYLTLLDASGNAVPDTSLRVFNKIVQVCVTLAGLGLIPVATAAVVDGLVRARLADVGPDTESLTDHVVVAGLGHLGARVVLQLHDLGIAVVCVETDEQARGVSTARRLGLPIVFGDAAREDTLRLAGVQDSRALLLLTSSDVVNLEAALQGRALREDLRVVLRLFDDDLAERVERNFGFDLSRSVSRLAASAFAAAMMERQVIGTMSIGRNVLMIAEIPVANLSALAGSQVSAANEPGDARVIGVQRRGSTLVDWALEPAYVLEPQDRLIILVTRAGLGRVLARSISAVAQPDAS